MLKNLMEFYYTDHAEENVQERNLSKKIIEDVVKNPEKLQKASLGER